MNEEMSDLVALFVLGVCTFYSVWLSMEFSPRSKLHLLWTIPVGFFGCFVALAIFSLAVSQANDFLFIAAASVLFLPFPIWLECVDVGGFAGFAAFLLPVLDLSVNP